MTADEWRHRAEREAAAIVDALPFSPSAVSYSALIDVVAIGWLQGNIAGTHQTLSEAEQAFERIREALT